MLTHSTPINFRHKSYLTNEAVLSWCSRYARCASKSYLAMAGHLCMQLFSQINVIFRKRFSPTRIACFRASDFWYNRALIHALSILLHMKMCDYEWFAVMIFYSFNIVLTARIIFHTIQFVSLATQAFPPTFASKCERALLARVLSSNLVCIFLHDTLCAIKGVLFFSLHCKQRLCSANYSTHLHGWWLWSIYPNCHTTTTIPTA